MLIDITRYPPVVLPEECRSSVVVRTATTSSINGVVVGENPLKRGTIKGKNLVPVPETASTQYGGTTYHETRLPLRRDVAHADGGANRFALIYEAASSAKDTITDKNHCWRVQITVIRKDSGIWGVTIVDMTRDLPLMTIATKTLDDASTWVEPVPLARAAKAKIMAAEPTFWDRIANDD